MEKGLTVPKCVLINLQKIPKMPKNYYDQIVCLNPKVSLGVLRLWKLCMTSARRHNEATATYSLGV
jgi:hypothetical protein